MGRGFRSIWSMTQGIAADPGDERVLRLKSYWSPGTFSLGQDGRDSSMQPKLCAHAGMAGMRIMRLAQDRFRCPAPSFWASGHMRWRPRNLIVRLSWFVGGSPWCLSLMKGHGSGFRVSVAFQARTVFAEMRLPWRAAPQCRMLRPRQVWSRELDHRNSAVGKQLSFGLVGTLRRSARQGGPAILR